jgi:hypothetical protein
MSSPEVNEIAQQAVISFLNEQLTKEDLKGILRNRKVGFYGRLQKAEMAQAVAGVDSDEVYLRDRSRQRAYRDKKATMINDNQSTTHDRNLPTRP